MSSVHTAMPTTFDIENCPPGDRSTVFAAVLAQCPVSLDISVVGASREFGFSGTSQYFGSIFLASCRGRGAEVLRDHRRVAQDRQRTLLLSLVTSGTVEFRLETSMVRLVAGDLIQFSSTTPFSAGLDDAAGHTLMIAYSDLALPEYLIETPAGQRIDTTTPLGRIAVKYLRDLGAHGIYLPDSQRQALEQPTLDILRALLATAAGGPAHSRTPLHVTLPIRMEEYLRTHLRDRDLNIARLATAHGVSERYAYLVLAQRGISLGDWLRSERLSGAAKELLDAPGTTIADIAAMWAFPDHANFTRAFRRAFGVSPREYRMHQARALAGETAAGAAAAPAAHDSSDASRWHAR